MGAMGAMGARGARRCAEVRLCVTVGIAVTHATASVCTGRQADYATTTCGS